MLASTAPALAAAIRDLEAGNVSDLMASHLDWTVSVCTPPGQVSISVSTCSDLGVPVGTRVRMFPQNVGELWWQPETQVEAALSLYLSGSHPTLELVARKNDGSYFISVGIDGRHPPGETFDYVRITFRTSPANPGQLTEYQVWYDTSTPLDTIREDEHFGAQPLLYDVIYVSPALRAKDKAWADNIAAHAHDPIATPAQ